MAKRSAPFGYMLAANGLQLVKNPEEQEALLLIQQLRYLGWTYEEIQSRLEAVFDKQRSLGTMSPPSAWKTDSDRAPE